MTLRTLAAAALSLLPSLAAADQTLATYYASSGSLPPEYAWGVDVTITDTGKVTLTHCMGYVSEGPGCTTRTGKANAAQVEAIRLAVAESGLLENPAQEAPAEEIPIGGGSVSGSVTVDGQTVTLMAFPRGEDSARVTKVLSVIYAAIPQRLAKRFLEGN